MVTQEEINKKATDYGQLADPLNQTLEKQADIRMGFIGGAQWMLEKRTVRDIDPIVSARKLHKALQDILDMPDNPVMKESYNSAWNEAITHAKRLTEVWFPETIETK